jgi:Fe-S-cluster containining protein
MNDTTTIGLDRPEEDILTYELSDEALESAAGYESERVGKYSIAWCTFLTGCPT